MNVKRPASHVSSTDAQLLFPYLNMNLNMNINFSAPPSLPLLDVLPPEEAAKIQPNQAESNPIKPNQTTQSPVPH
jgi:hypothetical protein